MAAKKTTKAQDTQQADVTEVETVEQLRKAVPLLNDLPEVPEPQELTLMQVAQTDLMFSEYEDYAAKDQDKRSNYDMTMDAAKLALDIRAYVNELAKDKEKAEAWNMRGDLLSQTAALLAVVAFYESQLKKSADSKTNTEGIR